MFGESLMLVLITWLVACSGKDEGGDSAPPVDTRTPEQIWCDDNGFGLSYAWDAKGPYGSDRWDVAEDFTVPTTDGKAWTLSEHWMGCESFLFVPDMPRSDLDDTPITTATDDFPDDIKALVAASPRSAHWFFFSDDVDPDASSTAAADQVADVLGSLDKEDAAWWGERLHVIDGRARELDGWLADALSGGMGDYGMAIDRTQHLRGVGSYADIERYSNALNSGGYWPFENNVAYAAYDAQRFEVEATTAASLDPNDLVVPGWQGEVISEYADMPIAFPDATDLAQYDRLLIDVDMRCPDHSKPEFNNCGAWDYIANVLVDDGSGSFTEISRMITSYHRETHWIVDA